MLKGYLVVWRRGKWRRDTNWNGMLLVAAQKAVVIQVQSRGGEGDLGAKLVQDDVWRGAKAWVSCAASPALSGHVTMWLESGWDAYEHVTLEM